MRECTKCGDLILTLQPAYCEKCAALPPGQSEPLLADCILACNILQDAPEINPSNYDHDQVCHLNAAACEAYQILNDAIKTANAALTSADE